MFQGKEQPIIATTTFLLFSWLSGCQVVNDPPITATNSPTSPPKSTEVTTSPTTTPDLPPARVLAPFEPGFQEVKGKCYGLISGGGGRSPTLIAWDRDNGVTLQDPNETRVFILDLPGKKPDEFDIEKDILIIPKGPTSRHRIEINGAQGYLAVTYQSICTEPEIEDSVIHYFIPKYTHYSDSLSAEIGVFVIDPEKRQLKMVKVAKRNIDLSPLRISPFINIATQNDRSEEWINNSPSYSH